MGSAWIRLSPTEELVLSERAASAGGHETLDYIPGAKLLGVAARHYGQYGQANALRIFHGGSVRFGNARPMVGVQPGVPVPFAWHERKVGPSAIADGWLMGRHIANYQHTDFEEIDRSATPVQPKQLRRGYLSADGQIVALDTVKMYRARTAIAVGQRTAADGQFFAYESLAVPPTQVFVAPIEWDDDLAPEMIERIKKLFNDQTIRVGRSRSAEYGSCQATWHGGTAFDERLVWNVSAPGEVTLWLLSDLAVETPAGVPCLTPTPEILGLPQGRLVSEKSFIRTRTYSPFNSHYRAFETERNVIAQGSVLCFALVETWTDEHSRLVEGGLGLYRQLGLGRVIVNHPLLATPQPAIAPPTGPKAIGKPSSARSDAAEYENPFLTWLAQRAQSTMAASEALPEAIQLAGEYRKLLDETRRYLGVDADAAIGPGASQWSTVGTHARKLSERQSELMAALFDPESGWCRRKAGWEVDTGRNLTIGEWLVEQFVQKDRWVKSPLTLQYLAHEIRNALQRERLGS